MISNWFKKLKFEDAHPAEETLLACVDGELSDKESAKVRKHLENCWSCRAQLDELQETITLFVSFRNQIQNRLTAPPPNEWGNFDRQLAEFAAEVENEKISIPNRLGFWHKFRRSLDFGEWSPVRKQIGIGSVATVLIVALLWQMVGVQNVSATELLQNSIGSQTQVISEIPQAVVYQKLRVERAGSEAARWEIWRDTTRSRYRQNVNYSDAARSESVALAPILRDLSSVLRRNRMNPQRPLSAESFKAWRDSLAAKSEEVAAQNAADGEFYILKIAVPSDVSDGIISSAELKVRSHDWHVVAEILNVKAGEKTETYAIYEEDFQIQMLSAFKSDFFDEAENPPTLASVQKETQIPPTNITPSPGLSPSETLNVNANTLLTTPSPSNARTASAELEVEVLRVLNQVGADIGEETTVTRKEAGELLVQGVVESQNRKSEILNALAPLIGQPGLIVRIETSQEAQKRVERERDLTAKNKQNQEKDIAVSAEPFETGDRIPADAETRRYLRSKGMSENNLTTEVNRFATATLNRSNGILLRALALKNLAIRFSDAQLRSMKPEARNQWLNLIAARASEIENQNRALREELGAVFGGIAASGESVDASDEAGLKRAVVHLSELAAANDRAVRAAFTFSSGASTDAVKGSQFRQSLGAIEGLANGIEAAARKLQNK
jgi:hypothetical protein